MDKCQPFGASISCANFQLFSDTLAHIVSWKVQCTLHIANPALTNYLDDFLFIALTLLQCNGMNQVFLNVCEKVGCPISMEKTEWATQLIVFLGVLLNGRTLTMSVPMEKTEKAMLLLNQAINSKKAMVKFIQRMTGVLNFINKAIVPERTFTRGMYSKLKLKTVNGQVLKDHHHVYLNREFILDCKMWRKFLEFQNVQGICRPFVDFYSGNKQHNVIAFYSDASRSEILGCGAVFDNQRWFAVKWPKNFIKLKQPSIEYLELYALVAGMLAWNEEELLNNARITVFCDNVAVVHMINNLTSSCANCLKLIRVLVLDGIVHNRRVTCQYVKSADNILADALSQLDFQHFWKFAPPLMNRIGDRIPAPLWPIDEFWDDQNYLSKI